MRMLRVATIALTLLVLIAAGCSGDDDTASTDPWGLVEIPEPTTQEEINMIFLGMPDEINGMDAYRDDPDHVGFVEYTGEGGERAEIAWTEVGVDGPTTVEFLDRIAGRDEFATVSSSLTAGGSFVWLEGSASDPAPSIHLLWWGDPTDGWVFIIEATSIEHRDALIDAFIASSTS